MTIKLMAIDPGIHTGYCYARVAPQAGVTELYVFQAVDEVDDLWRRLKDFEPRHIIYESFEFRNAPRRNTGVNLFPRELIGVARLYSMLIQNCAAHSQTPAQGKSYYSDNVLRGLSLYKRGVPHGMDALRHMLQFLTFGPGYQFKATKWKLLDKWEDN